MAAVTRCHFDGGPFGRIAGVGNERHLMVAGQKQVGVAVLVVEQLAVLE